MATPRMTSGALVALLALWMLGAPLASSTAASASSPCFAPGGAGCKSALAIARASDIEEEAAAEEPEGGEEGVASAEAEEEEEEGSGTTGSPSSHKPGASSKHGSRSPSNHGAHSSAAVLSRLTLTPRATAALRHGKPLASTVAFSFMLNAPAKVHVTLVMQTSSHGGKRWTALPDSLTTSAGKGQANRNLTGHNRLSPGRYRLTAKPLGGRSRSIYLSARP
jgi:hypothetical protein